MNDTHITISFMFLQVLRMWMKGKRNDYKVENLILDLNEWQKQDYLSRAIWQDGNNIFSPNLLSPNRREHNIFYAEDLDWAKWVPKLCKYFDIPRLDRLRDVHKDTIKRFINRFKDERIRSALRSVLRELRCLHIPQLEIDNFTDLPNVINKEKMCLILNRDEDDETKFKELIDKLECTIWKWHKSSTSSYEFLTILATLSLFDFNIEDLSLTTY